MTYGLQELAYYAEGAKMQADHAAAWAQRVGRRAPFETKAEAHLDSAEAALLRALEHIRNARETYRQKDAA